MKKIIRFHARQAKVCLEIQYSIFALRHFKYNFKIQTNKVKKLLVLFSVLILISSFTKKDFNSPAATKPSVSSQVIERILTANQEKLVTIKINELEKIAGRKLKLKEKIAFKIYQYKIKKDLKHDQKDKMPSKGKTAFILGLISIASLFIPYVTLAALPLAILAIIIGQKAKRENPKDSKAQTGIILGIVTLGLFVLAIILVIAILSGGWWV